MNSERIEPCVTLLRSPAFGAPQSTSRTTGVFGGVLFNAVVVAKRVDPDIVYVDDTACLNAFMLPVVVMLARDASNNTHSIA